MPIEGEMVTAIGKPLAVELPGSVAPQTHIIILICITMFRIRILVEAKENTEPFGIYISAIKIKWKMLTTPSVGRWKWQTFAV